MTSYDVPAMMKTSFYEPLTAAGWQTHGTHQGDEWTSSDGQFEIRFAHSMSILLVRYRRTLTRQPDEATETFLDRKSRAGWNTLSRDYGYTATGMHDWATRALNTIFTWCDAMKSVALAPGEE